VEPKPGSWPARLRPPQLAEPRHQIQGQGRKTGPALKRKAYEEKRQNWHSRRDTGFRKKEIREGADLYAGAKEAEGGLAPKKKGAKKGVRKMGKTELTVPKAIKRRVKVGDSITVGELAKKMGIKFSDLAKKLMAMGIMATINHPIDYDSAVLVASEFGYEVERSVRLEEDILGLPTQEEVELKARPPVVTIMGHVDHGKTSFCWMPSERATSLTGKPAALPNISVPITFPWVVET
jgi:translation initiation factor IF-2